MNENMTTAEAAKYIGLSVNTLAIWRMNGNGPAYVKLQRKVIYRRTTIDAWLADQERITMEGKGI